MYSPWTLGGNLQTIKHKPRTLPLFLRRENNWRCFLRRCLCALNMQPPPHVRFKGLIYGSRSLVFDGNVLLISTLIQPLGFITHSCRHGTGSKSSNKRRSSRSAVSPSPFFARMSKNELAKDNCGCAGILCAFPDRPKGIFVSRVGGEGGLLLADVL